ncbi:unnamed protein product [Vitrella brassicaformis CCMP3155]|uniref:Uncharacterized protein n=2 Tax=Vitrella brassicaformis TaxID=1169539 RepID=A0A0G4EPJ7_VITBC|nr:unnamed protein product [Vitrella brassicaformis CCMP3155]|eukprot:CEL99392.1 unnamed protein product [Vitrella brassicaformis CCMP3155]
MHLVPEHLDSTDLAHLGAHFGDTAFSSHPLSDFYTTLQVAAADADAPKTSPEVARIYRNIFVWSIGLPIALVIATLALTRVAADSVGKWGPAAVAQSEEARNEAARAEASLIRKAKETDQTTRMPLGLGVGGERDVKRRERAGDELNF